MHEHNSRSWSSWASPARQVHGCRSAGRAAGMGPRGGRRASPSRECGEDGLGTPLTDDDRWPWLDESPTGSRRRTGAGVPGIITCSALKRPIGTNWPVTWSSSTSPETETSSASGCMRGWTTSCPRLSRLPVRHLGAPATRRKSAHRHRREGAAEEADEIIRRLRLVPGAGAVSAALTQPATLRWTRRSGPPARRRSVSPVWR